MQELILITPRSFGGEPVDAVNARELWKFLEVGKDFSSWIKNRIRDYGFVEDTDFLIILSKSTGGRPTTDYFLTLDMAKELSMVERNEKGRQARRYFIAAEKRLKEMQSTLPHPGPDAAPSTLEASDARAYAQLLGQVRSIYGPMGADKVYRKLPLPDIEAESQSLRSARKFRDPDLDMGEDDIDEATSGWLLLDNLMSTKFARYGTGSGKTIGEILLRAMDRDGVCWSAAADKGIFVNPRGWNGYVAFPEACPFLDRVLACTYWAADWCLPLSLLPGAKSIKSKDFRSRRKNGVVVPNGLIHQTAASNDIRMAV